MPKRTNNGSLGPSPTLEAIRQFLSKCDVLKEIPADALDQFARIAVFRELAPGDKLWSEGDGADFAIVRRGQLEVRKGSALIDIMLPFQALGYSTLLGKKHTATVIAPIECHVFTFDAHSVLELSQACFPVIRAILADSLALVSKLNADVVSSKWPLFKRICHRILWLSRGKKQTIDITHQQLAELTGSTKWSVSRVLKRIEATGAIRTGFTQIEVIDMDLVKREELDEPLPMQYIVV